MLNHADKYMNWNNTKCWSLHLNQVSQKSAPWSSISTQISIKIFHSCWFSFNFGQLSRIWSKSWPEVSKIHRRVTPKPHLSLHKSIHIFLICDGLMRQTHNHRQMETCRKSQCKDQNKVLEYAEIIHSTHLDMAPKRVVAVKLTHLSIAGAFHFSINENVPGEQGHFSTHVNPIHNLSDVMILRLPWGDNSSGISPTGYNNTTIPPKKKKWKGSILYDKW